MHSCEVTACDFAADGVTVVSAGVDGKVVLWSTVTGFQLQVFTLHHGAAIKCLSLNMGKMRSHFQHSEYPIIFFWWL